MTQAIQRCLVSKDPDMVRARDRLHSGCTVAASLTGQTATNQHGSLSVSHRSTPLIQPQPNLEPNQTKPTPNPPTSKPQPLNPNL